MIETKIKIGKTILKTPIIGASGCSGWGEEIAKYNNMENIAGFVSKSLTYNKQKGNKAPRIFETSSGLLNSIGLENNGIEYFIKNILPNYNNYDCVKFINIAPFSRHELIKMINMLESYDFIDGYEINISCPNIHKNGNNFNSNYNESIALIEGIRKITKKTLIIKLSPVFEVSFQIARFAEKEGFDAISFTNTYIGMAIDIERKDFIFKNKIAGLSGPAIKPLSLFNVYKMLQTVNIPVIGIGGIRTINDIIEYLMIGAHAIEICTGLLVEPNLLEKLNNELIDYMKKNNFNSINEIIGIIKE